MKKNSTPKRKPTMDDLIWATGTQLAVVCINQGRASTPDWFEMLELAGLPKMVALAPNDMNIGTGHQIVMDGLLYTLGQPATEEQKKRAIRISTDAERHDGALMLKSWPVFLVHQQGGAK